MRLHPLRWSLLVILLLVGAGFYWLTATDSGMRFIWSGIQAYSPVPIQAEVHGHFIGPFRIERLRVDTKPALVEMASADLDWNPWGLLKGRILFSRADIRDLRITLHERPRKPRAPPHIPGSPLPLEVRAQVHGLTVITAKGRPINVENVTMDAAAGPRKLRIYRVSGAAYGVQLDADGVVGLDLNRAVELQTRWSYTPPQGQVINGRGRIDGILARPHTIQELSGAVRASIDGSLTWLDAPFHWTVQAKAAPITLSRLHRPWRSTSVGGQIRGEGGSGTLHGEGQLTLRDKAWGEWKIRTQVARTATGWRVPLLLLDDQKGPARIALSGLVRADGRRVNLDGAWSNLAWPWHSPAPEVTSPKGRISVEGSLASYHITGGGEVARKGLPGGHLDIAGSGNRAGLALDKVELAWLDGVLNGTGRLEWAPNLRWEADLRGENVNPGRLQPDWPGRIGGLLSTRGARTAGGLTAEVVLKELHGQLRGLPVSGGGKLMLQKGTLRAENVSLRAGEAKLAAGGALGRRWDLHWELTAARIQDLLPGLEGRLQASGTVLGARESPRLQARGKGHGIAWRGKKVETVALEADIDLSGKVPWDARLDAANVTFGENVTLRSLSFGLSGGPNRHRLVLDAAAEGRTLHLEGEGRYAARVWELQLVKGRVEDPVAGVWKQQGPTSASVSKKGLKMGDWCWTRGDAKACFAANGGASQGWQVRGAVRAFPLQVLSPLVRPKQIRVNGRLDGYVNLDFAQGLNAMDVELHATEGTFRFDVGRREAIHNPYRRVDLTASADGTGIHGSGLLLLANGDHARADFSLPHWRPGEALTASQPLGGSAEVTLGELAWISVLFPEAVPTGRLEATVTVAGTLGAPMVQGGMALRDGQLALPALGIALKDMQLSAYAENETTTALQGTARSGAGQVRVSGQVTDENGNWRLKAHIAGENVEAVRLPEAHVLATPDLSVEIRPHMVNVTGTLQVPKAQINLPKITAPVHASPDVVLVGQKQGEAARKSRWTITSQVDVVFGDDVRLQGYGLSGRLGGHVTIVEPASGGAVARGEINILDGKYNAYGQDLTIEQGRLLYGNSPVDNPGLDFRAVRQIEPGQPDSIVVGIVVTGRLKKPEVRLYSKPPMDDSQVLAYLVLGRPIETATSQEADVLQRAAISLGIVGGTALAREVASRFGLDVINVQGSTVPSAPTTAGTAAPATANGNVPSAAQRENAELVLGKYLSPRLYIQYAVGLLEPGNSVRVRYKLNSHWSLEAQSGSLQSGADILYTIEK